MLRETFAQKVKETRLAKKVTQEQLADSAGFSVSYVSLLERGGRSASLETIETIAKALKVSPLTLLGG